MVYASTHPRTAMTTTPAPQTAAIRRTGVFTRGSLARPSPPALTTASAIRQQAPVFFHRKIAVTTMFAQLILVIPLQETVFIRTSRVVVQPPCLPGRCSVSPRERDQCRISPVHQVHVL